MVALWSWGETVEYMIFGARRAFTMLEMVAAMIVGGLLIALIATNSLPILKHGQSQGGKRVLTAFIAAQQQRHDLVGEWYSVSAANGAITDVDVVEATAASTNERTVSMATSQSDSIDYIAGAVLAKNGSCLIWRAAESDAAAPDVRYEVVDFTSCDGNLALEALGGNAW